MHWLVSSHCSTANQRHRRWHNIQFFWVPSYQMSSREILHFRWQSRRRSFKSPTVEHPVRLTSIPAHAATSMQSSRQSGSPAPGPNPSHRKMLKAVIFPICKTPFVPLAVRQLEGRHGTEWASLLVIMSCKSAPTLGLKQPWQSGFRSHTECRHSGRLLYVYPSYRAFNLCLLPPLFPCRNPFMFRSQYLYQRG